MGKSEILKGFEIDLSDPGSEKSGEYLHQHLLQRAKRALQQGDREGLVDALRGWLRAQIEPETMLAVSIARELVLVELRPELEYLRAAIEKDQVFPNFYICWVDEALSVF